MQVNLKAQLDFYLVPSRPTSYAWLVHRECWLPLWYDSGFPNALPDGRYDLEPTALLIEFL